MELVQNPTLASNGELEMNMERTIRKYLVNLVGVTRVWIAAWSEFFRSEPWMSRGSRKLWENNMSYSGYVLSNNQWRHLDDGWMWWYKNSAHADDTFSWKLWLINTKKNKNLFSLLYILYLLNTHLFGPPRFRKILSNNTYRFLAHM